MDESIDQEDGSSSELDISNDIINGCIKSLDDDIEGPSNTKAPEPPGSTQSSRSSSSSSSSSSSDSSSSSSSKSSKSASSSHNKKSKEKNPATTLPPITTKFIATTDRVLYPARFHKKPPLVIERSHKSQQQQQQHQQQHVQQQHRARSRSRGPRPTRESGYKTDGSVTSESIKRRKSRAPSTPRITTAPVDIDLDLRGLQLSTEPSTSVKLTKRNVNLMARKNDTNNNNNSNNNVSKVRPMALNLELNRRLLEHKMDLNGRSTPFSASSCKLGFGLKSGQSFQELTATSKVMAPSWTAENEKISMKPVKYAKSLPRSIKSRRTSVASRAGSVRSAASTISRMRRCTTPAAIKNNEYVTAQVSEITAALAKCSISTSKASKISKIHKNNVVKKKKTVSKRRNKKQVDNDTVPAAEDHKLPLKKRHYLITEEKASNVKRKRSKKAAPPGIFEPTEQHEETTSFDVFNIMCPIVSDAKQPVKSVVDNILTKMEPTVHKRKRRRANRTGFPTPKRPKKKVINDNASDTSSIVKKRRKKEKIVPDEDVQMLTARQLQLKQQKELELTKTSVKQETRTIRGRAKSVCHIPDIEISLPLPAVKRKRRQTVFIDRNEIEIPPAPKQTQPVALEKEKKENKKEIEKKENEKKEIEKKEIEKKEVEKKEIKKKRRQTVHLDVHPSAAKKPRESLKPETSAVKLIPKNVYNGDTQKKAFVPSLKGTKCRCSPNQCGESCLNRSMFIECDVSICGKSCTNTIIQTGGLLNKDVEKFQTEQKGYGVRTKKDIAKKTLILEYTGEVLFKEAFRQRMQTIYKTDQHHYCLELSNGLVLDGHRMGSLCRFVNHSCKPNCGMAKIYVDGLPRMILQAEEDITAGTELTYDYKFDNFEDMTPQQCFCGADSCRGTLSAHMKTPRRLSMSYKDGEAFVKRTGRKGKSYSSAPKSNSCFLMRNLRRVEKYHPDLMTYYQNMKNRVEDDPKIGFAFVSKTHENSPPSVDAAKADDDDSKKDDSEESSPVIVHQPLSEQSQVLWQICERLEKSHAQEIVKITIPLAPSSGHSNHDRISLPLSFDDIKLNVKMGHYDLNPLLFHYNMKIMLDNVVKFYGVNCPQFHTMNEVRDVYKTARTEMIEEIQRIWEDELLVNAMMDKVVKKPAKNRKKISERHDDEDIVNCHCGRFLEEGLMIQCQKCLTWQHVDCAGSDGKTENYSCVKCEPRKTDMEIIKKDETTADGFQCYLTLMRGDLQIRVGDAVYVLRDIPIDPSKEGGPRHTYETIGNVNYFECDIVRVETLYKDGNGESRVLGHHYLRPNEVYHEPSRKFYTNELMRTSIFESIPVNLVIDTCWVLDPNTYFKGRPINSIEQHVYICEYKVDKLARVFSVIKKSSRQPISIKPYAFYKFEELLRQRRNHLPHDIDHVIPKKIKKELLQQSKSKEKNQDAPQDLPLMKEIIHHRPAPRKILSMQDRIKNLESCVKKIKKPVNDTKVNNNNNIKHNEITVKTENSEVFDKNVKKRGRRGKKKVKS